MRVIRQTLDDIIAKLSPLPTAWMDDTAQRVIAALGAFPKKDAYIDADIRDLLAEDFETGLIVVQLFLGLSQDELTVELRQRLGKGGAGVTRFRKNPEEFVDSLKQLDLLDKMTATVSFRPAWSDILVERLRSGRGKAIRGQRRGRSLEDLTEAIVREVFGTGYEARVTFTGADNRTAKCDFAIPSRAAPAIVIESKGYGATGSKMSDIIGDLQAIIDRKRRDTTLIFVTDGLTWRHRAGDLQKIVAMQNRGDIGRIYTTSMREQFVADLQTLKQEHGL